MPSVLIRVSILMEKRKKAIHAMIIVAKRASLKYSCFVNTCNRKMIIAITKETGRM
jgi:hypothetical protein